MFLFVKYIVEQEEWDRRFGLVLYMHANIRKTRNATIHRRNF